MTDPRPCSLPAALLLVLAVASRSAADPPAATYDGRSVAQWQTALSDKDAHMRRRAAYALGQFGPAAAGAVAALVVELDDRNLEGAWYAADTLGRIGPPAAAAVAPLARAMQDPENDAVMRHTTARALGRIGPAAQAAVPALTKALSSKDAEYRVAVAAALWQIDRQPSALVALAGELKPSGGDGAFAAAQVLGELKLVGTEDKLGPTTAPVVAKLIAVLDSPDDDLRRAAIDSLGRIGVSAIDPLTNALDGAAAAKRSARFIAAVAEAFGWIADGVRRNPLFDRVIFGSDDWGNTHFEEAIFGRLMPALAKRLADPRDEVQAAAAGGLARVGLRGAPTLLDLLMGKSPRTSAGARRALVELEHYLPPMTKESFSAVATFPGLVSAIRHSDPAVRAAGFRLFAAVGVGPWGKDAVPALRAGLADPNPEIRRNAATALARIENPDARSLQSPAPRE